MFPVRIKSIPYGTSTCRSVPFANINDHFATWVPKAGNVMKHKVLHVLTESMLQPKILARDTRGGSYPESGWLQVAPGQSVFSVELLGREHFVFRQGGGVVEVVPYRVLPSAGWRTLPNS